MDIDPTDIIYVLQQLAEQENLLITRAEDDATLSELEAKGHSATDFAGSIVLVAVGKATYSIATMIMGMTPEQRQHLAESVKVVFQNFSKKNVQLLLSEIASNPSVKSVLIDKLIDYFSTL